MLLMPLILAHLMKRIPKGLSYLIATKNSTRTSLWSSLNAGSKK
uniref:Alternative protein ADRBK2 n=1 Tax=Homo sapiens TaxID=9606 RepID=L0R4T6_HUMAN|nr:alternative protein ADRBK2 [Homo sapiens]